MSSEAAAVKAELNNASEPLIIGRYALFDALASGGMATVHLGRLLGAEGFGRTVAVKRLHTHYTSDQDFVTMFMDEARIVARIRHPNVVPMVDVIESSKGLFLIMEYVHGESFSKLLRTCRAAKQMVPIKLLTAVMHGVLLGLHAAHETKGASGELLDVVHRDVSPQNIIVGADGVARVLDFGVAKAAGRAQVTREGQIKGKLAYMAPEQIRGKVDRRADVFAAAVVLWEALSGRRLHEGAKDVEIVTRVVQGKWSAPSEHRPDIPPELDAIVLRGLDIDPDKRYANAREMALDLERKVGLAPPSEVGEWVEKLAPDALRIRAEKVAAMEKAAGSLVPDESIPPPPNGEEELAGVVGVRAPLASIPAMDHTRLMEGAPQPPPSSASNYSSVTGAASASSSVLAGTGDSTIGTPIGTAMPMPTEMDSAASRRKDLAPLIAIVSFCAALALVGAGLGAFSIYTRSSSASEANPAISVAPLPSLTPSISATATATATATASAGVAPVTTPSASASSPRTPTSAAPTAPSTSASSSTATPTSPSSTSSSTAPPPHTTPTRTPTPTPQPTPKPPAPPKTNCDPPYTTDEQGHRHYKLECMENQ